MRSRRFGVPSFLILTGAILGAIPALAAPPSPAPASAAQAQSPDNLDQKRIHADYNDGNFERVTSALEGFMSRNKTYSQADSVFIAKHLAVVYSANPGTREKGKYYMFRLLELLPSAKLVDMFVSDEIDRIFEKVREEFITRQKSFGVDTALVSLPPKAPPARVSEGPDAAREEPEAAAARPAERDRSNGRKTAYMVAGGAALVAVGVSSYFLFSGSPKKTEKTYVIP